MNMLTPTTTEDPWQRDQRLEHESRVRSAERAQRAVREMRKLLPGLTGFGRALTGDPKLRVVLTSGSPCTDGSTVYLRPPIELGDVQTHDRRKCNLRDPDSIQVCEACRAHENVMIVLYHELSHIRSESFAVLSDQDREELIERALVESGSEAGTPDNTTRTGKLQARLERKQPKGYIDAAQVVSPFLPMLLNALEDARVNATMYTARPGTKKMFTALNIDTFKRGTEQADGTFGKWSEMKPNAQVVIGAYAVASGLDITGYFDSEVEAALQDPELVEMLGRIETARDIGTIYRAAFPILEKFRSHGFCKVKQDPEDDPTPEPQPPTPNPAEEQEQQEDSDDEGEAGPDSEDQGQQSGGDGAGEESEQDHDSNGLANGPNGPSVPEDDSETSESGENDDEDSDGTNDSEPASDPDANDEPASDPDAAGGDSEPEPEPEPASDEPDAAQDDEPDAAQDDEPDEDEVGDGTADIGDPDFDNDAPTESSHAIDRDQERDDLDADPEYDDDMGSPGDVSDLLDKFTGHDEMSKAPDDDGSYEDGSDPEATPELQRAVNQSEHFDAPSMEVAGLFVTRSYDDLPMDHRGKGRMQFGFANESMKTNPNTREHYNLDVEVPPENILGPALQTLRSIFTENKRAKHERNLKSGHVDGRVLAKRVPVQDARLFQKKLVPGKRDYFVVIGLDISSSTSSNGAIRVLKASAMAKAELMHRLGVKFAVYAHTGTYRPGVGGISVEIVVVKDERQPWDSAAKSRLADLIPGGGNIDSHSLEFYRKVAERSSATDKVILYTTDGEMHDAEDVLQREINFCKRNNISVVGIGIGTDSPVQWGLDTIVLDAVEDIPKVVKELQKRLS